MTDEQKEILIAKMLDAPSSLSDVELEMIMLDGELREIYEMSSSVSGAFKRQVEIDTAEEWARFRPRIRRRPTAMRWVMRVAAIFLGVTVIAGIAGRIIDRVFSTDLPVAVAGVELPPESDRTPAVVLQHPQVTEAKEAAEIEPAIVRNHSSAPDHSPAEEETTDTSRMGADIDIDEYLRMEQARIDNDLAVQAAEYYKEEYDGLVSILDATGVYNPQLDNAIRRVTMQ